MEITYHNSATVVIKDDNTKILIDPWLTNGEYFGAWGIYPPYDFKPEVFNDVDYIYISHVHPDHCSPKTLSKLNKKIPVLIHNFSEKYLKKNIEKLGFRVIELENNKRMELKNNLSINIIAADNCNPEICGQLFGCAFSGSEYGTAQIDTMAVIDNKKQVVVNTNDCPFEIAEKTARIVSKQYQNIDLLLVGYAGASSYPQCFNFSEKETEIEANKKGVKRLRAAVNYVQIFNPRYFMPFAGRYTLSGKNYILNKKRGEPDLDYAVEYLTENIDQNKNRCIVLNSKESFDFTTGKSTKKYEKINQKEKEKFTNKVLSKIKFSYEYQPKPSIDSLIKLLPRSYERFNDLRKEISYFTETKIILKLNQNKFVVISCNDQGYEITTPKKIKKIDKFISMVVDDRLLYLLLQGPKKAHWNNADIGSHIQYRRIPNVYEMGLMYCWNYFYSGKYID